MEAFEREVNQTREWFNQPRFAGITRLYSARQIVEQRGGIQAEYTVAAQASAEFHALLRDLFSKRESITTFGPYSPGQAVTIKRMGIKGIYLGGWATSAKGSINEDPGADLASYPLSQVPDEAAAIVRALLTADKNQRFARSRMNPKQREKTPEVDYRPFIIADADTGHGGDAHVRNLVRRFAEAGVSGVHIEDQKPGTKKCGHQGGKVLVSVAEQIMRLNTARFQFDVMRVGGIIVARTDAEAANLLEINIDERDHPFILGATNPHVPSYRNCTLALLKRVFENGIESVNGFKLHALSNVDYDAAKQWFDKTGLGAEIDSRIAALRADGEAALEKSLDELTEKFSQAWETAAGMKTYSQAVADAMKFRDEEDAPCEMTTEQWLEFAGHASLSAARQKARELGIDTAWDCELSRTPEGYYQVRGGIEYAIAKSLAVAPYADLLWMETKTADLHEARRFAQAIHAAYPDKMLAYNLSPSFNWDTTGMSDQQMREFPKELARLGFVFNFITYGGHQIDGVAAEEFAAALNQDGMLALARLQRKIRLFESPYRTPQTLVGGPRLDAALAACSGRTATTTAMGKGSTQFQHLAQTEVPPKLLEGWLKTWTEHYNVNESLSVRLHPHRAGSELLEISVTDAQQQRVANVVLAPIQDRRGRNILSIRDQNTLRTDFRQKRLMTLIQLFLIHRYRTDSVHYVTPTDDNQKQAEGMKRLGIFDEVSTEIGDMIVASVCRDRIEELLKVDRVELNRLIVKT